MSTQQDRFRSLAALMSELSENKDFRFRTKNRSSTVTVMSPHGGFIEPGTSAIAEAVAGRTFNLFDFQGLQVDKPSELHVTSTRFRHPLLSKMLAKSQIAVSIHGMGEVDRWNIWLGGLGTSLKARVANSLTSSGFSVLTQLPKYKGEDPRNIVNLVPKHGVQLELPSDLIDAMFGNGVTFSETDFKPQTTELFKRFARAVRGAVLEELKAN